MYLNIKASTDRTDQGHVDMSKPYINSLTDCMIYLNDFTIAVYETTADCVLVSPVAMVQGALFHESALMRDDEDILQWAEKESTDTLSAIRALCQSLPPSRRPGTVGTILQRDTDPSKVIDNLVVAHIQNLYVDRDYRDRGVATYILSNLYDILNHKLGIGLHHALIKLEAYEWCVEDEPPDFKRDPSSMSIEICRRTLEGTGYRPLSHDREYYHRDYCSRDGSSQIEASASWPRFL